MSSRRFASSSSSSTRTPSPGRITNNEDITPLNLLFKIIDLYKRIKALNLRLKAIEEWLSEEEISNGNSKDAPMDDAKEALPMPSRPVPGWESSTKGFPC